MNITKKIRLCFFIDQQFSDDESEDSDEEILTFLKHKTGNYFKEEPRRINIYMESVIFKYNSKDFQSHFRLTRESFEVLLQLVGHILKRQGCVGRQTVDPKKQLLSVLWLLATPDSFRSVGDRFNMAKSTLSVTFARVIKAINSIAQLIIKWPRGNENTTEIQRKFCLMAGIPYILGAVDGTYIPIKAPQKDSEVYITRKCHYAITLQAICIPSLIFTDIFVGYPGSVSDTRIFKNSDIYKMVNRNKDSYLPNNTVILGDKAYPPLEWCVPPFIDRGNLTENQKKFNKRHSQTRQTIERAFALLFGRFRRLKFLDVNKFEMIPHTVLAACILHNICLNNGDLQYEDYIAEGQIIVEGNNNLQDMYAEVDQGLGQIRRNILLNEIFN